MFADFDRLAIVGFSNVSDPIFSAQIVAVRQSEDSGVHATIGMLNMRFLLYEAQIAAKFSKIGIIHTID